MAPMRVPPPERHAVWQTTQSIESFACERGLSVGEVKQLLGSGQLPFIELAGQIRVVKEGRGMKEEG